MATLADFKIEVFNLTSDGSDSHTVVFANPYNSIPQVTATCENYNINVFVEEVTLSQVTISTSTSFAGLKVFVQVIGT